MDKQCKVLVQIVAVKVREANRSRVPRCCHLRRGVSNRLLTEQFPFLPSQPCICISLYNVFMNVCIYTVYIIVYHSMYIFMNRIWDSWKCMNDHECVVPLFRIAFISQPAASNSSGWLPYLSSLRAPTYPHFQSRKKCKPSCSSGAVVWTHLEAWV